MTAHQAIIKEIAFPFSNVVSIVFPCDLSLGCGGEVQATLTFQVERRKFFLTSNDLKPRMCSVCGTLHPKLPYLVRKELEDTVAEKLRIEGLVD